MIENPAISVIIPTLNEAHRLPKLLQSLVGQRWLNEIIVSDGGSMDQTRDVCLQFPVNWVSTTRGKSHQFNIGASHATGNILLFLHADSQLPPNALESIPSVLQEGNIAGTFQMAFDDPSPLLRFYAGFTRFNSTLFTYGDQGLFLSKSVFDELKGYPETPFLEDVEMVKNIKKRGRMGKSPVRITTSAQRFRESGLISQQLRNIAIVVLYKMGISPEHLIKFYPYK